jgi:hypothetical protein
VAALERASGLLEMEKLCSGLAKQQLRADVKKG